ncbi:mannose-6-phosphate isomerase-like protein (cupin superfamily) [Bradyrhizobium sp. USDA 4524]|uniref:cupin domain-containing protein n=1 Tax=unclassified Bradyrhizobium TaxID=2631580 RepID=UPI00209F12B5|nr:MULTISPECIES: cupin domain-containing protein [unclassified Bradyrhizobium]MCP1845917.1 mannose-6-phosphate isomerase-like protein (cupin superfamily) [Bradyrhizobium sp. USDA 4538]MCP1907449.1 mannose-6-phosphate isomerase-like protein (cupin superfamily) [Bradyrhizobium sp. USDA 4537]MCP1985235.1 mannose-6-phosphate isomerase-like protein (cupin superfamily) [Bradyrhizobium sp. USDA 4539]
MTSSYVRRAADAVVYSPANHTGIANQRIISRETVGASRIEVLIGTIAPGHGALPHAHPNLEQASYVFSGKGLAQTPGKQQMLDAGGWSFSPLGVFHRFEVTSDVPVRLMVIYAPPYSENPNAAVVVTGLDDQRWQAGASGDDIKDIEAAALPYYRHALAKPIVTGRTVNARFLEIHDVEIAADGGVAPHSLPEIEQVLFVKNGAIRGRINGQEFAAVAQEWVFVPEGAEFSFDADRASCGIFVIRAGDPLQGQELGAGRSGLGRS